MSRVLPVLLAAGGMLGLAPAAAAAAAPGVLWDCTTVQPRPSSVDLNCSHADATLSSLRWEGRSAQGWFTYPEYTAQRGTTLVSLAARVHVSRPRALAATPTFTRLTVRLFGGKRERGGLSRQLGYVLSCDIEQGWLPARVARPC